MRLGLWAKKKKKNLPHISLSLYLRNCAQFRVENVKDILTSWPYQIENNGCGRRVSDFSNMPKKSYLLP